MGAFSDAINQKLDRDLNNLDIANTDIIVARQDPTEANSYTWYRKYKSGWVEQGGYREQGDNYINLPIPMRNNRYTVTAHGLSSATSAPQDTNTANRNTAFYYSRIIFNQSATGFNLGGAAEMQQIGTYWEVKGMAA